MSSPSRVVTPPARPRPASDRLSIAAAASRLGTTPRMLRYRERLGLLSAPRTPGGYREFGPRELAAAGRAAELEQRYDVGPSELAFGLRVLSEPAVAAEVRLLGELAHRLAPPPLRALDFDADKARRLLQLGRPVGRDPVEAPPPS